MALQTEYDFTLPKGYVDDKGNLQRKGTIRLAAAGDEILPMKDPRVLKNPAYLAIIVLSRVITQLGELQNISPGTVESLFIGDLTYLQEFYRRINGDGDLMLNLKCPHCGEGFEETIAAVGE
jgi:hypothetical protein